MNIFESNYVYEYRHMYMYYTECIQKGMVLEVQLQIYNSCFGQIRPR